MSNKVVVTERESDYPTNCFLPRSCYVLSLVHARICFSSMTDRGQGTVRKQDTRMSQQKVSKYPQQRTQDFVLPVRDEKFCSFFGFLVFVVKLEYFRLLTIAYFPFNQGWFMHEFRIAVVSFRTLLRFLKSLVCISDQN